MDILITTKCPILCNYSSLRLYFCLLFIQDGKKRSGNEAVVDLPRRPLPVHPRHPRHPLPVHPHRPLLHQVHHTHPAAVGVALAVVVSVSLKSAIQSLALLWSVEFLLKLFLLLLLLIIINAFYDFFS